MSFNWSEFQYLAWELTGKPQKATSREAKLRSAISRSYYAAFRTARNYLRDKEGYNPFAAENSHQDVINWFFNQSSDQTFRNVARYLNRLRKQRNRADYDDRFPDLEMTAKVVIPLADKVIKIIEGL